MDTLVAKMVDGSQRPFALGVSQIADMNNDGERI